SAKDELAQWSSSPNPNVRVDRRGRRGRKNVRRNHDAARIRAPRDREQTKGDDRALHRLHDTRRAMRFWPIVVAACGAPQEPPPPPRPLLPPPPSASASIAPPIASAPPLPSVLVAPYGVESRTQTTFAPAKGTIAV